MKTNMSKHYDRDGKELELMEWAALLENREYKKVEQTTLQNGKVVSTVWLGLDHQFGDGPPLIFETMVFAHKGSWSEEDCERYTTEQEAKAGHKRMCEKWADVPIATVD